MGFTNSIAETSNTYSDILANRRLLAERYGRKMDFFHTAFPEFSDIVVDNILSDTSKKIRSSASVRIWHATSAPENFCSGINRLRVAGWLALAKDADIQRYAEFIGGCDAGVFSIESILNARRLILEEAKFRRIFVEISFGISDKSTVSNPLLSPELASRIEARTFDLVGATRSTDILTKRLSRRFETVMGDSRKLVLFDENTTFETAELSLLLRTFIRSHIGINNGWDGVVIDFPHTPREKNDESGMAYAVTIVRLLLRQGQSWRSVLSNALLVLSQVTKDSPENIEARAFARSFSAVIRKELSSGGVLWDTQDAIISSDEMELV